MQIQKLSLRNIGPFEVKEQDFSPGITAILGPNGVGKSTLLNSIYSAISNDFGRTPGVKTDNILVDSAEDAESLIELSFSHNGNNARICRSLRPAWSSLQLNGSEFRRSDEIAVEIEKLLGIPLNFLGEYIFVDQWEMFSWMSLTPAKRTQAFQKLFGLDRAEQCWDAVGKAINDLPALCPDDELIASQRLLIEANDALIGLNNRELELAALIPGQASVDHWQQQLRDAERHAALVQQRADIASRQAQLTPERRRLVECRELLQHNLAEVTHLVDADRAAAESARESLARLGMYEQAVAQRESLQRQAEAFRQELASQIIAPRIEAGEAQIEMRAHQTAEAQAELAAIERFLNTFDPSKGIAECPTCGTLVSNLAHKITDYQARQRRLSEKVAGLIREQQRLRGALDKHAATKARHTSVTEKLELVKQTLDKSPLPPAPTGSRAELGAFVAAHAELRQTQRELEQELSRLSSEVSGVERSLDELANMWTATRREHDVAISDDQLAQARGGIAKWSELSPQMAEVRGRQAELARHVRACEEAVARQTELARQSKQQREWQGRLERVRSVLHRDKLPRLVIQSQLELLEHRVNELLEQFEAPFRVRTADDLSFLAQFANRRRPIAAGRLSGGQKVVLALAFRVALNAAFADQLGLLCLDEPTAGLDERNLRCVELAVAQLRRLASSRGLQCIVVTHEERLAPLFDSVVDLTN